MALEPINEGEDDSRISQPIRNSPQSDNAMEESPGRTYVARLGKQQTSGLENINSGVKVCATGDPLPKPMITEHSLRHFRKDCI